jgi:hypothetical protein
MAPEDLLQLIFRGASKTAGEGTGGTWQKNRHPLSSDRAGMAYHSSRLSIFDFQPQLAIMSRDR